jgi:MerR family glutamine synthetase transcriptional repressor
MTDKGGSLPVYPIGSVMKMTGLTGRQIRYYEQMELIEPVRSKGNQRLYSDLDVEKLNLIKGYIDSGYSIEGIRSLLTEHVNNSNTRPSPIKPDEEDGDADVPSADVDTSNAGSHYPFLRSEKLVSLYPVNNRAKLVDILTTKNDPDKPDQV